MNPYHSKQLMATCMFVIKSLVLHVSPKVSIQLYKEHLSRFTLYPMKLDINISISAFIGSQQIVSTNIPTKG